MKPDCELLRQYAEHGDDAAFTEVVRRHVNLVYASAVRLLNGNATMAQDVTQVVFTDLARKAGGLSQHTSVAGWLHTSVRFAAANAIRSEQRRRLREQEASAMSDHTHYPNETAWLQMRPLIDEAVGQLQEAERDAVLLRFFEEKSHREVGAALGLTENAARMRVERGLEKLRAHLARYGVTASVVFLAATLSAHAASNPAPASLAAAVAGKALLGAGLPSTSSGVAKAGLHTLFGVKSPIVVAGSVALATAAAAALIFTRPAMNAGPSKHSPGSAPSVPIIAPAAILATAQAKLPDAPDLLAAATVAMSATTTAGTVGTTTGLQMVQTVQQVATPLIANASAPPATSDTPADDNAAPVADSSSSSPSVPPGGPESNPAIISPSPVPIIADAATVVVTTPVVVAPAQSIGSPAQWSPRVGGNGHFYLAVSEPSGISWAAAQAFAAKRGGYLAVVANRAENDFVFSLVNSPGFWKLTGDKKAVLGPWLGAIHSGSAVNMNYGWQWINRTGSLSFTNWAPFEPRAQGDRLHFFAWGGNPLPTWDNALANQLMPGFVVEFDGKPRAVMTAAIVPVNQPVLPQNQYQVVPRGPQNNPANENPIMEPRPVPPLGAQNRPGGAQRGPLPVAPNNLQPLGLAGTPGRTSSP